MFAVIRTGGKQYRVSQNDRIRVERLSAPAGSTVTLDDVLMVGGTADAPLVQRSALADAAVFAEVVGHVRTDKILVFKKKRRQKYRRLKGHRQGLTELAITGISPTGEAPAAVAEPEPAEATSTAAPEAAADAEVPTTVESAEATGGGDPAGTSAGSGDNKE
ncbi:MAG: 50S ribosomal protein L21 [Rhodospirillales bacterium]|nr:MAG: 50S ribosomal protein L21 [Rhodospirillales bacterium]